MKKQPPAAMTHISKIVRQLSVTGGESIPHSSTKTATPTAKRRTKKSFFAPIEARLRRDDGSFSPCAVSASLLKPKTITPFAICRLLF